MVDDTPLKPKARSTNLCSFTSPGLGSSRRDSNRASGHYRVLLIGGLIACGCAPAQEISLRHRTLPGTTSTQPTEFHCVQEDGRIHTADGRHLLLAGIELRRNLAFAADDMTVQNANRYLRGKSPRVHQLPGTNFCFVTYEQPAMYSGKEDLWGIPYALSRKSVEGTLNELLVALGLAEWSPIHIAGLTDLDSSIRHIELIYCGAGLSGRTGSSASQIMARPELLCDIDGTYRANLLAADSRNRNQEFWMSRIKKLRGRQVTSRPSLPSAAGRNARDRFTACEN